VNGDPYQGRDYTARLAGPDDAPAVRDLLAKAPMEGWVELIFRRPEAASPEAFEAAGLSAGPEHLVLLSPNRAPRQLTGMYALTEHAIWLNGRPARATYLGLLRVASNFRGRLGPLRDGYASIPYFTKALGLPPLYYTSLAADNAKARRLLEAGLEGLPTYRPWGKMHSLAFSTALARKTGLLQPAGPENIPEMIDFYQVQAAGRDLSPRLEAENLAALLAPGPGREIISFWLLRDSGERLIGSLALWDRRCSHPIRVSAYRKPLDRLRPLYNLGNIIRRKPTLPEPGQDLPSVFIAFMAFAPAAQNLIQASLREALARIKDMGARVGLLGLADNNPVLEQISSLPHQAYQSIIENVTWEGPDFIYSGGSPQPEIALL
jgi:hypothetical protein